MDDLTMADDGVLCDVDMAEPVTSADVLLAKQCTDKWLEKMHQCVLSSSHFKEHWRIWVPRLYGPTQGESCLEWAFDEEKARRILFTTIEEFICDGGDPTTVLGNISGLEKPPSVCGRVFKVGEPTYSCRECGMDNTCVLCVDCFKQSEHRHHKYKMGTSNGGGCCDCGDTEAWKKAPFCNIHIVGKNLHDEPKKGLPEDMAERVRVAFDAILWYAYELLSMEHSPRVPADLCYPDTEADDLSKNSNYDRDSFCTVLYNDETHTFEQVINTLTRVLKCNQKVAIEYVTNIDREGRAVVKCSSFQYCNELRIDIEKYTSRHGNRALKVLVVHAHVVAHQIYAMRLLAWIQNFLSTHGEQFRSCFADVALKAKPANSIIEGVLVRDVYMWKSARAHWHRLLITSMLMEYETKKAFARTFTRKYGTVMKDFIRDDHDHSFSVSSLSVQIFTVPTLAHYLIAEEDALYTLLNAFNSECKPKCNREERLEFERNSSNGAFKRAQYMLYDLKYLLGSVPEKWTDPLRKGFLQGLTLLLNLLAMMQGMDAVSRQVGQHMEYEPEWESAFNLHIKLAFCVSLAVEWCATDKVVLVKAYRATLKKLYENPCNGVRSTAEVQEVADHSVSCLPYEVSSRPVSIHLPLTRFLAGLHLNLEKHGLAFDSPELQIPNRPIPEEIVEPVLRAQAMISQVHAGMWRRNGYALLNQLFFYHNVKCRTEMLDRDIVLLQITASVIESNEFLVHALNKFGLVQWAHPNFEKPNEKPTATGEEDNMRQTIILVEEFLQLLIYIVGERYVPGVGHVTPQDQTKKEIIQQLCIKPLPHSELSKTLPDDVTQETGLDDVVQQIATFKKPAQGSGKGVYELRPELLSQYNVFFYHYTREELSRSEEAQRKRRHTAGELECCPPPDLPQLCEQFSMLVNLLQCDVMLHLMSTILERGANLRTRSFSEPQLHKVLHLIGYALQEEESGRYPILAFTERARRRRILELMEELSKSPRVDAHKDLLTWTITKFKNVSGMQDSNNTTNEQSTQPAVTSKKQESTSSSDPVASEKDRRAKLAALRRAKLMAQMTAMQNTFIKENAKLFEEATNDQKSSSSSNVSMVIDSGNETSSLTGSIYAMDTAPTEIRTELVALGENQSPRQSTERNYTCILCQEQQNVTQDGPVLVLAAFVQQATVLCQLRGDSIPPSAPDEQSYLSANLGPAPHTSTCGHVMHSDCWQKYFDNVVMKEHRRPYRHRHPASFDVEKHEFLCPLCECLSNTILPLIPPLCVLQPPNPTNVQISYVDWLRGLKYTVQNKIELCHGTFKCAIASNGLACTCRTHPLTESNDEFHPDTCTSEEHRIFVPLPLENINTVLDKDTSNNYTQIYSTQNPLELSEKLKYMIEHYALTTYTRGLSLNQNLEDKRIPLLVWKSCAYTIHTIETLLRDTNKPLLGQLSSRQSDCLESLARIVSVFGTAWPHHEAMSAHAFRLISYLIENDSNGPCLLDWDSFGMLVALTMSLPYLHSHESTNQAPIVTGEILEAHIFRLVFSSHIIKIILQTDINKLMDIEDESFEKLDFESEKSIHDILKILNYTPLCISGNIIWKHVQKSAAPFLRCCVLFYRYITDIPSPDEFEESHGDTFEGMCRYLGVPDTCGSLFASVEIQSLIKTWCEHKRIQTVLYSPVASRIIEPLQINRLVELPSDYSELINAVSLFTCPNSDREDSRNPTMCLVCGEMLCSQSYCCQIELNKTMVGACTYHAHKCGAGVGVFLRVRECEILFLASPMRGCFVIPPYLDDYGETDQGLRRGNPLRLCPERYRRLQALWLGHCIHEEIARAIETSSNLMSTQWQHL